MFATKFPRYPLSKTSNVLKQGLFKEVVTNFIAKLIDDIVPMVTVNVFTVHGWLDFNEGLI